ALLIALVALALARRSSRKLEAMTQSYWELRYDFTRLRARVQQLDPEADEPAPAPASSSTVTFVPLSSMKKKGERNGVSGRSANE
ncbi:MAG: hypothetical protein WEB50_01620, partial [Vicinamibacterales bacterium]